MFVIDFEIEQRNIASLKKINRYIDNISSNAILEPPVVLNSYLSAYNTNLAFSLQVSATNDPTSYTILNSISGISVTNSGLFT